MSKLLVWQVTHRNGTTNTLGMMRGGTFAIDMVTHHADGTMVHCSQNFDTFEDAEEYLRLESDGGDFVLPPTECEVPEPPNNNVYSPAFGQWIDHVMKAVDREILHRALASATFTFGEPRPAFTR